MSIISIISEFFSKRKKAKDEDLYREGYNYAAGALLRKGSTPLDLVGVFCQDLGYYEMGITDAIEKLIEMGCVGDNDILEYHLFKRGSFR